MGIRILIVQVQLLQLVGNQEDGTSSDNDNHGELELEPKHKIFLSHSGVQKDFTEQLCVDLERSLYYPFFDKRADSLQKGRKFSELIFKAAQQCRVAVLILSEDFFTRSKWPMLELEAFVQAQKKDPEKIAILPVFLTISRDECTKNEARRLRWVSVWRKWAESGDRINVEKWVEALRVLGPSNGIEYVQSLGEVTLREEVVKAIRGLVPPEITWSVGQIEGRTRICKAICEKFKSAKPSTWYGVRVVGIHGTGGVGKTTFCKVLCDELCTEFQGKVCHGELGVRSRIELQKQVLRDLTDINHGSLAYLADDNRTTNLLNQSFRRHPVFLALDNVWQDSIEEAKVYLRAGFHPDSIVMVTARTIDLLGNLRIFESDCLEMPELDEEDAKQLFLHHAASGFQFESKVDEERILHCVRLCKFQKGANMGEQFLPLALKSLGAQLGSLELDPKKWVENLENLPKRERFNQLGEKEHPIFGVLRRGYDFLSEEDQLLFMDVVLFCPYMIAVSSKYLQNLRGGVLRTICDMGILYSSVDIYEWLSIVHQTKILTIKNRLQGLKAKSLLENIGDYSVSVHDLYLEFAEMEVKSGAIDIRRWRWYNEADACLEDLALTPSGNCWQNVRRFHLCMDMYENLESMPWSGNIERIKWNYFCNIGVLNLINMRFEVLDLRGLQCLRSLEVELIKDYLKKEGCNLIGLGELKTLAWLRLCNMGSVSFFDEIGSLTALHVLHLMENYSHSSELHSPPKLDKCIALRELVLRGYDKLKAFPDLGNLTSLRKIVFEGSFGPKEVVGLNSRMHSLQALVVSDCRSLRHISSLDDLASLRALGISFTDVQQPLNLCKLTNLQQLHLQRSFKKVSGFSESMPLRDLELDNIEEIHDLHLLRYLQGLNLYTPSKSMLQWLNSSFTTLEELSLYDLEGVRVLPDIHKLSRLRRLTIWHAPELVLEQLVLGGLVALEELRLVNCGTSVGIAELRDLHMLTNLRSLRIENTPMRSLPSFERLTQLWEFRCVKTRLAELPDLSGSILLEKLYLGGCRELTSVGNLAIVPSLVNLNVSRCHKLERLPDLKSFERLRHLNLYKSGVRLSSEDIMVLAASKVSFRPWDGEWYDEWDDEDISLNESVSEIEAMQLKYFTIHETTSGSDIDSRSGDGDEFLKSFILRQTSCSIRRTILRSSTRSNSQS